jgi:SAM-dependent methyltransferase
MKLNIIGCTSCYQYSFCSDYEKQNKKKVDSHGVWQGVMSPIRKCQHAICKSQYADLRVGTVLEVGCGSSRKGGFIKQLIEAAGNKWIGIDIVPTDLTTVVADVSFLPFADETFDLVIGNQTMEHWPNINKALLEIKRVMKVGSELHLNVPIHLHGADIFVTGDFSGIEKAFNKAGFVIDKAETWRQDHMPLEKYFPSESSSHCKKLKVNLTYKNAYVANFVLRKVA